VEGPSPRPDSFRAFLDSQQYSAAGILKYERVFGEGFVSTGGLETTRELVALLELQQGQVRGGGGGVWGGVGETGAGVRGAGSASRPAACRRAGTPACC
jgi:hypothetical protein